MLSPVLLYHNLNNMKILFLTKSKEMFWKKNVNMLKKVQGISFLDIIWFLAA